MSVDVVSVSDEVHRLVEKISVENDVESKSVKYETGALVGEGYGSQNIAVEVTNGATSLHLFVKYAKEVVDPGKMHVDKIYTNEIFFYRTVYPAYLKFVSDRGIEDGYRNAPKFYGAVDDVRFKEILVLENLRSRGYTMFNRFKVMNDDHLTLVLQTFAKFHAISFAIKDQDRKLHDHLCANCFDGRITLKAMGLDKILGEMVNDFISKLDPDEDRDILEKSENLSHRVIGAVMDMEDHRNEYSILTKGDTWSNNMMFLYEDELEEKPKDIMLIDYQLMRKASPVNDILNLFFSVVSKKSLENSEHYMKVYHRELSKTIKELGSNPEILYPYHVFVNDWNKLALFGFGATIIIIKIMLAGSDETPNFEGLNNDMQFTKVEEFMPQFKKEDEYMKRMKYITRYLIQCGHL